MQKNEEKRKQDLIKKMSIIDPAKWKGTGLEDEIMGIY